MNDYAPSRYEAQRLIVTIPKRRRRIHLRPWALRFPTPTAAFLGGFVMGTIFGWAATGLVDRCFAGI